MVQAFFVIKGIVGVAGVLALVFHMNRSWGTFDKIDGVKTGVGQRMRFLCLLGFGVLVTGASYDQVKTAITVTPLNWGAGALGLFLVATAVVSIIEAKRLKERKH